PALPRTALAVALAAALLAAPAGALGALGLLELVPPPGTSCDGHDAKYKPFDDAYDQALKKNQADLQGASASISQAGDPGTGDMGMGMSKFSTWMVAPGAPTQIRQRADDLFRTLRDQQEKELEPFRKKLQACLERVTGGDNDCEQRVRAATVPLSARLASAIAQRWPQFIDTVK